MSEPVDQQLVGDAVELAKLAGEISLRWFRNPDLSVERKADGTPVTEADRAGERAIREELARRWPDDAIVGEEEGSQPGTTGRTWFVDPVDGTKAFHHGVPLYCNLVAVHDADGAAVGVINLPALDETVYAGRGRGCFCNGEPARVSDREKLAGSYLTTSGFEYWPERWLLGVKKAGLFMRTWGDGYGYALVATGRVEAMVDPGAGAWDLAAMPVIVGEAGGRFTDLSGRDAIDSGHGIASNGHVHTELLAVFAE